MTDEEVTTKIEAIRKDLRDARNRNRDESTSGTGENSNGYSSASDTKKQRISRHVPSNDEQNVRDTRPPDNLISSTDQVPFRSGRHGRRFSENSSSLNSIANDAGRGNESGRATTTTVGNLVKDDATKEYSI